ncbi:MAG TPA: MFS transporter [Gemmatimonadaceae bacterium]|nr:MFS transporter [Gemmatimonadaceae bacterium]
MRTPAQPAVLAPRYRNPVRVLVLHRNFRLFWFGQTGSLVGTWMQSVAVGWLALELTDSAFMVGFVSAAGSLPVLLLTLYAGAVADRRDKLVMVKVTQSLLLVQAALLWYMDWSGHITISWLVFLSLLGGMINAFDIPARQSLIIELVARDDLVDAIALNSTGFNLARIIGPAIAAIVIDRAGLAWCFALNALSYLLVLIGLMLIRLPAKMLPRLGGSPVQGMLEGLAYMFRTKEVALLMSLVAVYSVFGIPYLVLMPVVARDTLHAGASGYAVLLAAVGFGAVVGAVTLATLGHRVRRGRLLAGAAYAFCAVLIAFAASRNLRFSAALLFAVGLTMILNNALTNGLLQTISPDSFRGRVMSAYAFVFVGLGPVGSLLGGAVASAFSAPIAVAAGATVMLLFSIWLFTARPELRRL